MSFTFSFHSIKQLQNLSICHCSITICLIMTTTVEDNPMISTSFLIWRKMGYIYQKDNRRFISLLPIGAMGILQISYLFFSGDPIEDLTLNSFLNVILLNSLVSLSI